MNPMKTLNTMFKNAQITLLLFYLIYIIIIILIIIIIIIIIKYPRDDCLDSRVMRGMIRVRNTTLIVCNQNGSR